MIVKRVVEKRTINGRIIAPAGAGFVTTPADHALLELFNQKAWANREKFWFDMRFATVGQDGFIDAVQGWLQGLDGAFQTLGRHPEAASTAQRVKLLTASDGMKAAGGAYPVVGPTGFGTLLSSANAKVPPAVSGVSKCTVAMLVQQPVTANGWFLTTDAMAPAVDQLAIGPVANDDRYYLYSSFASPGAWVRSLGGVNGPPGPPQTNTGDLCLLVVELDGTPGAIIRRSGYIVPLAGGSTTGAVVSRRFRLGSIRNGSTVFENSMDGIIEAAFGLPDVSADIRLLLKNWCLERHPTMPFYA